MIPRARLVSAVVASIAAAAIWSGCADRAAEHGEAQAASTTAGPIPFDLVERALRARHEGSAAPGPELLEAYRRTTEELAVRRALTPPAPDVEAAAAKLGPEAEKIRRLALTRLYLQAKLPDGAAPTEEQLHREFEAARSRFDRPSRRFLWHIYLQPQPDRDDAATLALAGDLVRQLRAGASFADLARQFSSSETRVVGGRLGNIEPEQLPEKLRTIAFSLAEGEVSDPIPSRGGVLIFRATQVVTAKRFTFDEVRPVLLSEWNENQRRQMIHEIAGKAPPAAEDRILAGEAFERALALGSDEVVLRFDDLEWTVGELRDEVGQADESDGESPASRLRRIYESLVDLQKVARLARIEGFATANAAGLDATARAMLSEKLFQSALDERMEESAKLDDAELTRFYEDNRYLYETPLRLRLRTLQVPIGPRPAERLAELEAARSEVAAHRLDLEAIARRFAGEVSAPAWVNSADLTAFEPKVTYYLLDLKQPGVSIPFQLNQRLCLVELMERVEPASIPLEKIVDRVRGDYLERNKQALYRRVTEEILRNLDFRFNEQAVRERLGLPEAVPST